MQDFKDEFNNEDLNEMEFEKDSLENDVISEDYTWYEDEYRPAMSGTVSDRNALSLYRPKLKKPKKKRTILAAVLSSVITTAICCGIFAFTLSNMGVFEKGGVENQAIPQASTLSVAENGNGMVKTVVNKDANALSIPDIYSKASPSVVSILCTSGSGFSAKSSSGSGVIITKDGYIVTNNHVIEGASIITVKTKAGQTFTAQLIGRDERTDLAVLKVSHDEVLPAAEIGDSTALRVGDLAVAIGNPLQEELVSTLTVGYISAINRTMVIDERQMTMLQTDAAINPGNSGGALINVYGQVIGITTAKSTGYDIEGLGFAIPMNEAVPIIDSIIKNGYVTGRPLIGITGIDVTEQIAKANDLPIGVYVHSVISGGSADLGGIKEGDVIVKCEGKDIKSVDDINEIRDSHKVGDKLTFVISRNGKEMKCSITLQEEKPVQKEQEEKKEEKKTYIPSDFFSYFGW